MRNILVLSDLSERSDRAVARAVRLANRLGCKLTALHVVDDALPAELARLLTEQARPRLERFLASQPDADSAQVEVRVEIGDAVQAIIDVADGIAADLVIFGIHRGRPFFDLLRETTVERLVRLGSFPALVVRDPADHDYLRVVAGVDASPASAAALRIAHVLAPEADTAVFHAVHVAFTQLTEAESEAAARPYLDAARAEMARWRADSDLPPETPEVELVPGSPAQALGRELARGHPDLLAIGAHARPNLARMVLGTFAADLVRDPPCDLLIARQTGSR